MPTINLGPCACCGAVDPCASVTCPSDTVCLEGTCFPLNGFYCCYNETPPEDPALLADFHQTASFGCQFGPCIDEAESPGDDPVYNARKIKAGPLTTGIECDAVCTKFNCTNSPNYRCLPDADGEYPTIEKCREACRDQTACQPGDNSGFTTITLNSTDDLDDNFVSVLFELPYAAGAVRLEYNAFSIPDRFQLWGPTLNFNTKKVIASRVIKGDSQYRGNENSLGSCPDDHTINIEGPGQGFIVWNKPEAACYVELAVFAPCFGTAWEATLSFTENNAP
jgi:hypothetical protein